MASRLGENKRAGQRCGDIGSPDLGHRSGPAMDGFEATVVEPGMATLENQVEWLVFLTGGGNRRQGGGVARIVFRLVIVAA